MSTQTQVKTTTRTVSEYEIVRSDRIDLINQANQFVEAMTFKQVYPLANGAFSAPELTEDETRAYTAALLFLERQFDNGAMGVEVFDKRLEFDETNV